MRREYSLTLNTSDCSFMWWFRMKIRIIYRLFTYRNNETTTACIFFYIKQYVLQISSSTVYDLNVHLCFNIPVWWLIEYPCNSTYLFWLSLSELISYFQVIEDGKAFFKFCHRGNSSNGPVLNRAIHSSGHLLTLRFVSDYSNEDPKPKGFRAYSAEIGR